MYVENCNARHIDYIVRNVEKIDRELKSLIDLALLVMRDENSDITSECCASAAVPTLDEARGQLHDFLRAVEGYRREM